MAPAGTTCLVAARTSTARHPRQTGEHWVTGCRRDEKCEDHVAGFWATMGAMGTKDDVEPPEHPLLDPICRGQLEELFAVWDEFTAPGGNPVAQAGSLTVFDAELSSWRDGVERWWLWWDKWREGVAELGRYAGMTDDEVAEAIARGD